MYRCMILQSCVGSEVQKGTWSGYCEENLYQGETWFLSALCCPSITTNFCLQYHLLLLALAVQCFINKNHAVYFPSWADWKEGGMGKESKRGVMAENISLHTCHLCLWCILQYSIHHFNGTLQQSWHSPLAVPRYVFCLFFAALKV